MRKNLYSIYKDYKNWYGLSDKQMAQAIGISRRAMNDAINLQKDIKLSTAFKLAKYFDLPIEYLFNDIVK